MPLVSTAGAASSRGLGEFNSSTTPLFIEDVFSVEAYVGNGSSRGVGIGIDFSKRGGMVWTKYRAGTEYIAVYDTVRGASKQIFLGSSNAGGDVAPYGVSSFVSNGATVTG